MSDFSDQFQDAFEAGQDQLGDEVTYTVAATGVSTTVTAVMIEFWGQDDDKMRGRGTISLAAVPAPSRGDTVAFNGRTWITTNVIVSEDGTAELLLRLSHTVN